MVVAAARLDLQPEEVYILGLKIHNVSTGQALEMLRYHAHQGRRFFICTPNVHFVMLAQRDSRFRLVVNNADLCIPDGMGVVYASRLLKTPLRGNVAGRLFVPRCCELARDEGLSTYFLGARPGVAERAATVLRRAYPGLIVAGCYAPPFGFASRTEENERVIARLIDAKPDILFAALGNPLQEVWLAEHQERIGVPICMGVGSTLDVIAGTVRTAPRWMTKVGLEWLFRVLHEPRRLGRRYLLEDPPFLLAVGYESLRRHISR